MKQYTIYENKVEQWKQYKKQQNTSINEMREQIYIYTSYVCMYKYIFICIYNMIGYERVIVIK